MLSLFVILILSTWQLFRITPTSLVPSEDMGFVIVHTLLPEGSALSRTIAVNQDLIQDMSQNPLIAEQTTISGYSFLAGNFKSNGGVAFERLIDWGERKGAGQSDREIIAKLTQKYANYPNATFIFGQAPTIIGLDSSGVNAQLQSKGGGSMEE